MFSSSNNINPFSYFPSLPIPTQDTGDPIYLHYHHDLLQGHHPLLPVLNHPQMNESFLNMTMLNNSAQKVEAFDHDSGFLLPQKKPGKKDRHSKICTAHGVRGRRVRLSTDIAREFFYLQDMLGFDKASKTLGWLLDKSKSAIKELAKMKSGGGGSTAFSNSTSSDCDVVSEDGDLGHTDSKGKEIVDAISGEKMENLQKADITRLLAKESREKARARARERTREKMCTRRIHDFKISPETIQFKKSSETPTCNNILPQEVGDHHGSHHLGFGQRKMKACLDLGNQQNAYFSDFPYHHHHHHHHQIWDIFAESSSLNPSRSGT